MVTAFISTIESENLIAYVKKLANAFPNKKIILSGAQVHGYNKDIADNVEIFKDIDDLKQYLDLLIQRN